MVVCRVNDGCRPTVPYGPQAYMTSWPRNWNHTLTRYVIRFQ